MGGRCNIRKTWKKYLFFRKTEENVLLLGRQEGNFDIFEKKHGRDIFTFLCG